MTQEIRELLDGAIERRANINDFENMMAYQMLRLAGEQGADDEVILGAARVIARKSAGKWVVAEEKKS